MLSVGSSRSTWLTPLSSTTVSAVCFERVDERLHRVADGLAVGVRTRQQHRGARGDLGGQGHRVDLVGFHDGLRIARVEDGAEPLR